MKIFYQMAQADVPNGQLDTINAGNDRAEKQRQIDALVNQFDAVEKKISEYLRTLTWEGHLSEESIKMQRNIVQQINDLKNKLSEESIRNWINNWHIDTKLVEWTLQEVQVRLANKDHINIQLLVDTMKDILRELWESDEFNVWGDAWRVS